MVGFDPWYRAWTTQEERLVLNAILYPTGTAIPAATVSTELGGVRAHKMAQARPVPANNMPTVASRPVRPTGAGPAHHDPH
jgi:hypothetical protein